MRKDMSIKKKKQRIHIDTYIAVTAKSNKERSPSLQAWTKKHTYIF